MLLQGKKIKLKTSEEATKLIENMLASDHAIMHDRTHQPKKKSLLELSSHDALLAHNKLLYKQLEILIETLSKLPTKLSIGRPSHSSVKISSCIESNLFCANKASCDDSSNKLFFVG